MNYDNFFVDGDKPYAENLNDSVLLANAFDFKVFVKAPNQFSNNSFEDNTSLRKCGVSTVQLLENFPTGVSVSSVGDKINFTTSASISFKVYPNFNQFGSWLKLSWVCSDSSKLSLDLLTKDNVLIQENIPNNGDLSSSSELNKLDEIIVRINSTGLVSLSELCFYFNKKSNVNVEESSVKLVDYYTKSETVTVVNSHHDSGKSDVGHGHEITDVNNLGSSLNGKASAVDLTNHTGNGTVHVTGSDKTTWNGKQDKLSSGSNIKTINGNSLLGSGNIDVGGGGVTDYDNLTSRPKINNVLLTGNKTSSDLGLSGSNHNHDSVYYVKSSVDSLLSGKSDSTHNHDSRYTQFGHSHDDRYFTETEVTDLLNGKSDTTHVHDGRYYTESEVNSLLGGKSDNGHVHDDRYYTETEVNTLLSGKSDIGHNHNDIYYNKTEIDTKFRYGVTQLTETSSNEIRADYLVVGNYKIVTLRYLHPTSQTFNTGTTRVYSGSVITEAWRPIQIMRVPHNKLIVELRTDGYIEVYNGTGSSVTSIINGVWTYIVHNNTTE